MRIDASSSWCAPGHCFFLVTLCVLTSIVKGRKTFFRRKYPENNLQAQRNKIHKRLGLPSSALRYRRLTRKWSPPHRWARLCQPISEVKSPIPTPQTHRTSVSPRFLLRRRIENLGRIILSRNRLVKFGRQRLRRTSRRDSDSRTNAQSAISSFEPRRSSTSMSSSMNSRSSW